MIAVLAIAVQAGAAAFAPPLDKPVRVETESVRLDHGVTRRFTGARRIVFRRTEAGYRAEVTVEPSAVPQGDDDDPAAMFSAGIAKLAGRTMVIHLDAAGKAVRVEDQAAAWQAMLDGIAAQAPGGTDDLGRKRAGRIRAVTAALAQMPEDRQRLTLASLVTPLIAMDIASEGAGPPRSVKVPGQSAFGAVELDGVRVVRMEGGMLEASVSAEGAVSIQGPDGAVSGRMSRETLRRVDPATGLVMLSRETVRTLAPDGSLATERTSVTRISS